MHRDPNREERASARGFYALEADGGIHRMYQPEELRRVRVHAVETLGSTAILVGRDRNDRPVIALAGTALTRAVTIALAHGEEPCVDLPTWAVLAETRPDPDPLTFDAASAQALA